MRISKSTEYFDLKNLSEYSSLAIPTLRDYLKSGLPDKKLFLVDVDEEPLRKAEKRFQGYAQKAIAIDHFR